MKKFKAVVAYHSRNEMPYQLMKIQGDKPSINGLFRVGMWLSEKDVESLGKFADLTVIIGKLGSLRDS